MNEIIELINSAEDIIILAHDSEDADAVGSSYAMKSVLLGMGKKAECIFSDIPERHLDFMGKSYILPDEASLHQADLCICLDCGDLSRIGKRKPFFESARHTVCIDHHETNVGFGDAWYVDAQSPATGEILYELFIKMGVEITKEIAENLYAAISSDTGSFKYSNVRPRTMLITAELLKCGIDHARIARFLYDSEPIGVMKFKGYIMNTIEQYCGGKLNVVCASQDILDKYGIEEKDTGDIVNIARAVTGCEIAVSVRETPEKIKISLRSNGKHSVSDIAAKFGGGGHAMAAGAAQKGKTLKEVKDEVIRVCEEIING
ncbi:MAG: bifunctional oligoribonuclease/PAP phosphatase NrnA [Clostridia bacterium]|nr:bifunctional oligoribonuclease/PAP phosphatase NrnA [Clostridia bacterium]